MEEENKSVVLIAVDGSEHSERAFNYYATRVHRPENYAICIHVADPPILTTRTVRVMSDLSPAAIMPSGADFMIKYHEVYEAANKALSHLTEKYEKKLEVAGIPGKFLHVINHKTGEAILELADEEKAGMIVTGTRGLGTIRRTLLGSVSEYVLHHAHCPRYRKN